MARWEPREHLPHFELAGGTCHLTWRLHRDQPLLRPEERTTIREILRRDHLVRCEIFAAVVMDDHVHALVRPYEHSTSMQLAAAWKSISSHRLCRTGGRAAPLWQRDSYQRWLRHQGHLSICVQYIRDNPRRKWPGIEEYRWVLP